MSTPGSSATKNGGPEIVLPADIMGRQKVNYDVIMMHGKRGDGKSTLAVAAGKRMLKIWQNIGYSGKVFANFRVDFASTAHPRLVDHIVTFPEWCHDCIIVIDELAASFPSLRSTSREQLLFQTFLQQIRKLHISLIFTTQYPTYVGAGSNIQINWYIKPHLWNWEYYKPVGAYVANNIDFDAVDWFGAQTGIAINHRWPPQPWDATYRKTLYDIKEIYTEFNTDEIIPPFWVPNREQIMQRGWQGEFEQEKDEREQVRLAQTLAREEFNDIAHSGDASTIEEWVETQKVILQGKPAGLTGLLDSAKLLDTAMTVKKLETMFVGNGFTVGKVGQSKIVGYER